MSDFTSHILASLFGTIVGVLTGYWLLALPKQRELFQYKKAYFQQADKIVELTQMLEYERALKRFLASQ